MEYYGSCSCDKSNLESFNAHNKCCVCMKEHPMLHCPQRKNPIRAPNSSWLPHDDLVHMQNNSSIVLSRNPDAIKKIIWKPFSGLSQEMHKWGRVRLHVGYILSVLLTKIFYQHGFLEEHKVWVNNHYWSSMKRNEVVIMTTIPEFLATRKEMLVVL